MHAKQISLFLPLHFSQFLTSDIPNEVQYFAWAPEGNKLVSLDRQMLLWRTSEMVKHHLSQTLDQREKRVPWGSRTQTRRPVMSVYVYFQAYVWGHNVYIKSSPTSPPQQVTFNGKMNEIFNGIPDWVYEGEWNTNQEVHLHVILVPVLIISLDSLLITMRTNDNNKILFLWKSCFSLARCSRKSAKKCGNIFSGF